MPVAKEQIRQIIADNNLSSVADVYSVNVKSSAPCYENAAYLRRLL